MNIKLAYGKTSLDVVLPDRFDIDVITPKFQSGLIDEYGAISNALHSPMGSRPLRDRVVPGKKIAIVFSDITRATPYEKLLPPLLDELSFLPDEDIILFNATGTHRANTHEELISILGKEYVDRFEIVQNDCHDVDSYKHIGTSSRNNDIWMHADFVDCGLKILTGFIEPHFFAGFSGGGKAAMPGLALLETIMHNHGPTMMDSENSRWGITNSNPIWEEVMEAALMLDDTFLFNISLNKDHDITGVFAGDVQLAHSRGCEQVKENAMAKVQEPYDIVISSNSGYPLDLNLYQAVKGMSAASQILKPGGHIIMVADCWDGIPDHGEFGQILSETNTLKELLQQARDPNCHRQDMWQCHILALICQRANVYLHTQNISDEKLRNAFINPCKDVGELVNKLHATLGYEAKICVLPEGPQTIPYY